MALVRCFPQKALGLHKVEPVDVGQRSEHLRVGWIDSKERESDKQTTRNGRENNCTNKYLLGDLLQPLHGEVQVVTLIIVQDVAKGKGLLGLYPRILDQIRAHKLRRRTS